MRSSISPLILVTIVSLLGAASLARPAQAAEPYVHMSEPPQPRRWYGGELLLSDAASLALIGLGASLESDLGTGIGTVGGTGLVLAPMFIHGAHGNPAAAVGSLALRLGLPSGGLALGLATCNEEDHQDEWFGCLGPAMGGFLVGGIVAVIVDDFVLAWKEQPATPQVAARGRGYAVGLAPRGDGGMTLSFGGSF